MRKFLGFFAAVIIGTPAYADSIYLGLPAYGGSGCPGGSVSAVLSPDAKSLSILFDEFQVSVGGRRTFGRKSCNVAIPVHVPQGMSVSLLAVDYRGYNYLPRGATSQFNVEYFFAGSQGPTFTRSFLGPLDDDYFIRNNLHVSAIVWSACGADVNLRTNASMRVNSRYGEDALATVDSEDVKAALIYSLQWRRCQ